MSMLFGYFEMLCDVYFIQSYLLTFMKDINNFRRHSIYIECKAFCFFPYF